jgi:hypothetical protein
MLGKSKILFRASLGKFLCAAHSLGVRLFDWTEEGYNLTTGRDFPFFLFSSFSTSNSFGDT